MLAAMEGTDLVFLDPDNGLEGATLGPKSAALEEIASLRSPGRALLLYHHQTRLPGGAPVEAAGIARRLLGVGFTSVDAIRLRPYSSRFYFLIDGDTILRGRLREFADRWRDEGQLYLAHG